MSDDVRVLRVDDVESVVLPGQPRWRLLRAALGVEAFGVNAWTADTGQPVIGEHDELGVGAGGHEELYLVLSGRARFTVGDEHVAAPAGTLVFVKNPALRRGAIAEADATTVLVVGGTPGAPFRVSPWERNASVLRHWESGDWEAAVSELSQLHAEEPESAGIAYNLACAEARAGLRDDALAHLAQAVALEPSFREHAQGDGDLDAVRDDPRFPRPAA